MCLKRLCSDACAVLIQISISTRSDDDLKGNRYYIVRATYAFSIAFLLDRAECVRTKDETEVSPVGGGGGYVASVLSSPSSSVSSSLSHVVCRVCSTLSNAFVATHMCVDTLAKSERARASDCVHKHMVTQIKWVTRPTLGTKRLQPLPHYY